jgi:hypothetical protein
MDSEHRPDSGSVDHNYSDYPELDHAPSFAWSGQKEAITITNHGSSDEKGIPGAYFSAEGNGINFSDDQRSMTR